MGLGRIGEIYEGLGTGHARACIVAKGINAVLLQDISNRDCTCIMVRVRGTDGQEKKLILCSAYLAHDEEVPPRVLRRVVEYSRQHNLELIVGCDANAHHEVWGSTGTNERGEKLLEFLLETGLDVVNQGGKPTFVTKNRSEVLDLTLCGPRTRGFINKWKVSDEPSLSDHRTICFEVDIARHGEGKRRSPKNTNWEEYKEEVRGRLTGLQENYATTRNIDHMAERVREILVSSYEGNTRLKTPGRADSTPWWNMTLERLRRDARRAFNKARKGRSEEYWDSYREAQRSFKRVLKNAKEEAWRTFCTGMQSLSDTARLVKILTRDNSAKLQLLRKSSGDFTTTEADTLSILLKASFPDIRLEGQHSRNPIGDGGAGDKDWKLAAKVVTLERVRWAIRTFEPLKAPGPDGIFPKMLQEGLDSLLPVVTRLFRGCIAQAHVPEEWRNTKVVFIPKPGRSEYGSAKDFRPISLTSFMLKTLERLVDSYIRCSVLDKYPFHCEQHAYQSGKSTETALHAVVGYVERALEEKEVALGAFIDIEGAFNCTTRRSIAEAAERHGVPGTIVKWIRAMLSDRRVSTEWGGTTVSGTVNEGCPQGGVLSPLLWSLVVDDLLRELNSRGLKAVGYADDIGIIARGKFPEILPGLIQGGLAVVKRWCEDKALSVNPDKIVAVIFTRKYKVGNLKEIRFLGKNLAYAEGVKYLGVYLDRKIKWRTHLAGQCKKALGLLMQCRRAIGHDWGMSPERVLWVYETIVKPKLTYAALVWWESTFRKTPVRELEHIHSVALRGAYGAKHSTPTAAIGVLLGQVGLHLDIIRAAAQSAYRIICWGGWRGNRTGHTTIRGKVLSDDLFDAPQDRWKKVLQFDAKYTIEVPSREDWGAGRVLTKGDTWYTDGSCTTSGAGIGICGPKGTYTISGNLGQYSTALQAEMAAVGTCVEHLLGESAKGKRITICSDSLAAVTQLSNPLSESRLATKTKGDLNLLARENKVVITWIPGHSIHKGNIKADRLAKAGAEGRGRGQMVGVPYQVGREAIERWVEKEHRKQWLSSPRYRWTKELLGGYTEEWGKKVKHLDRHRARLVIGLLTGHWDLGCFRCKVDTRDSGACRWCGEEEETPRHALCECRSLWDTRVKWLGRKTLSQEQFKDVSVDSLIAYCKEVGLARTF